MDIAERLVELALALDDQRLPVEGRLSFVKRELAELARDVLRPDGVVTPEGSQR